MLKFLIHNDIIQPISQEISDMMMKQREKQRGIYLCLYFWWNKEIKWQIITFIMTFKPSCSGFKTSQSSLPGE
jgi:hypothetical protein